MALSDITIRLLDTLQSATGARVRFVGQPMTPAQNYPAVYAEWIKTETTSGTFGSRGSDGRRSKRGNIRTHTYNAFVLMGQVLEGVNVDQATQEAAETLMDAIEADDTLRDVETTDAVARATVMSVQPFMGELGFGVQAEIQVKEL
jgi:hypothetical protein